MKIAVTGHRPNALGWGYNYNSPNYIKLKDTFKKLLIENNCTEAITGMALGVDQVFALAVIELKEEGMNISLTCAIPCLGHSSKWTIPSIELYNYILSKADYSYIVTKTEYTKACMQKRNEWMVDRCDLLIGVWNGNPGGTGNCIRYCNHINKQKYIIDPVTLVQDLSYI